MSKREIGLLVVNRPAMLRKLARFGGIQTQVPSVNLTHEGVFSRYRGFDGEPWPARDHPEIDVENGLAPLSSMSEVRQYAARIDPNDECDIVIVDSTVSLDSVSSSALQNFLGFDVGVFDSEWSHCSSILAEVLFGNDPEMRAFAARLNEVLLLSSLNDARELLALRERLLKNGAALEDSEVFYVYGMYAP